MAPRPATERAASDARSSVMLRRQSELAVDPALRDADARNPAVGLPSAVVSEMQQDDCLLSEAALRARRFEPER